MELLLAEIATVAFDFTPNGIRHVENNNRVVVVALLQASGGQSERNLKSVTWKPAHHLSHWAKSSGQKT